MPIIKDHVKSILRGLKDKQIRANLRKMFYILVSKEIIGNTKSDYSTLSDQTKNARMNGILQIDCFVDEVRQTFDNGYKDDDEFETIDEYIKYHIDSLIDAPDDYVESLPTWYKQKHYIEKWLEKAAIYGSLKAYLGRNRQVRIVLDRGNTSLGIMVENVRALRKVAKQEPLKDMHLLYYGDMDPSGDDMDRDIKERIESVNAKINVDEFRRATFKDENGSVTSGADHLQELVEDNPMLERFEGWLNKATREEDDKHPQNSRNWLRDQIRIRKSKIIAWHYPNEFPHFVVLTKEEEENDGRYSSGSGSGMPKGVKKIHFERVAITVQQIQEYGLPEIPEDKKTRAKLERDTKTKGFIEKHGKLMAVEVDALDALRPDVLERLVQGSYDKYYDEEIYKKEILDKYGTKKYKRKIRLKILQKIRDLEIKLEEELAKDDD